MKIKYINRNLAAFHYLATIAVTGYYFTGLARYNYASGFKNAKIQRL
mgnify:CR=1 FL=1